MVKTYRPFPNAADEEERHGGEGRQADQYSDRIRPVREYVLAITRHLVRIYLIHEHHLRTGNQTGVEGGGGGRGEGGGRMDRKSCYFLCKLLGGAVQLDGTTAN